MSILDDVKTCIKDEADYAYANFDEYKEEVLQVEEDEEPFDDFRYGMRRALEIVNGMLQDVIIIPKKRFENQESVFDKMTSEIESLPDLNPSYWHHCYLLDRNEVLDIIDKYKKESEGKGND